MKSVNRRRRGVIYYCEYFFRFTQVFVCYKRNFIIYCIIIEIFKYFKDKLMKNIVKLSLKYFGVEIIDKSSFYEYILIKICSIHFNHHFIVQKQSKNYQLCIFSKYLSNAIITGDNMYYFINNK